MRNIIDTPARLLIQLSAFLLLALLLPSRARAVAVKDVENVYVKDSTRYVTDMAGMLSPQAIRQADALMADIKHKTGAEPVIVIVDNLDGEDPDDYATELFELWAPGRKSTDDGVLMLISKEDRKFVIRTGYGVEGVLPDYLCWEILNQEMAPLFKQGKYEEGILKGAEAMHAALTNEEARQELIDRYEQQSGRPDAGGNMLMSLLWIALTILGCLLLYYFYLLYKTRGKETAEAYHPFEQSFLPVAVATAGTLGIAAPALLLWWLTMKQIRNKKHVCSNCGTVMKKLDEATDNLYLTPAQDAEERLKSVDYDVWLCPNCNQTDIIPFINKRTNYQQCPVCGARAMALVSDKVLRHPTTTREGEGMRTYACYNCHNITRRPYNIAKAAAPPIIIGGGGGGFGSGGGFGGGSFGGGMTGGGGSSGGW